MEQENLQRLLKKSSLSLLEEIIDLDTEYLGLMKKIRSEPHRELSLREHRKDYTTRAIIHAKKQLIFYTQML